MCVCCVCVVCVCARVCACVMCVSVCVCVCVSHEASSWCAQVRGGTKQRAREGGGSQLAHKHTDQRASGQTFYGASCTGPWALQLVSAAALLLARQEIAMSVDAVSLLRQPWHFHWNGSMVQLVMMVLSPETGWPLRVSQSSLTSASAANSAAANQSMA